MALLPEQTIPYKTYVKAAIVEALRNVFRNHPDARLQGTKVSIEYPTSELHYPSVVVRFFERTIRNAGVGHVEYLYLDDYDHYILIVREVDADGKVIREWSENLTTDTRQARIDELKAENANYRFQTVGVDGRTYKFRHYLYDGDIELAVFALSSLDRDLISDTVVQTLSMPDMATYTKNFFDRIYFPPTSNTLSDRPKWNYVNLNTDHINGFGETQTPQPWLSEDQLVYQTSYRLGIYGEFYSLPPADQIPAYGLVKKVNVFPYLSRIGEQPPPGTADPAPWGQVDNPEDVVRGEYDPTQWH